MCSGSSSIVITGSSSIVVRVAVIVMDVDVVQIYYCSTSVHLRCILFLLQLIAERSGAEKVLGLHFLGPNAGEVMQGFAVALR